MPKFLHDMPEIRASLDHLLTHDKVFKKRNISLDDFPWSYRPPDFAGLVRIVLGQQVSVKAAASMEKKLQKEFGKLTPEKILARSADELRALGLTRQKTAYIIGLAQAIVDKRFTTRALHKLTDLEVHDAITAHKGFGQWSAQMYLMFNLARPDIWPHGDLGIQEGMRRYLNLEKRPTAQETLKLGDRFAPHRTAASLLLWCLSA